MHTDTTPSRTGRTFAAVTTALLGFAAWLRGDQPIDDRGSDTSEKAFMIILAISAGAAVTLAALAFIASKTALFQ